ncbi:MAG: glycogen/starch synthase [Candidatus Aenigmatarchaeota archaeon]
MNEIVELKEKNIVIVSPELKSFKSRAGGLGQVAEELAKSLGEFGLNIYVVSCLYKYTVINGYRRENDFIEFNLESIGKIKIKIDKDYETSIYRTKKDNVTFIFLFNEELTEALYLGDLLKFAIFFGKGTLEALKEAKVMPHIIHLNDALTSLVLFYAKYDPQYSLFSKTKFVFTIHNAGLAYQQIHSSERLSLLNLPPFEAQKLIWNGSINLLYGGVDNSDIVNTVSEDYAINLRINGDGLREVFTKKNVFGILNGIDVEYWRDKIYSKATFENLLDLKKIKKTELINEIKLRTGKRLDQEKIIAIMPRRLSSQKGFDTIMPIIERLHNELGIQFIILGLAHPNDDIGHQWANTFYHLHNKLEGFVFIYAFDENLAKLMYSGADLIIYPSLPNKEPCGTGYMMALVNGTPVVGTKTGGLVDVIREFDEIEENGNGFLVWKEEYSTEAFYRKIEKAYKIYMNKNKWKKLCWNAFKTETKMEHCAMEYVKRVYLPVIKS